MPKSSRDPYPDPYLDSLAQLVDTVDEMLDRATDYDPVHILVFSKSTAAVNSIVRTLDELRFAESNLWSTLMPGPVSGNVMRTMRKMYVRVERIDPES